VALHPALGPKFAGTDALDARLALAGLLVQSATGSARAGILAGPATLVTTRADKFVDIAGFEAALTRGLADGASFIANDGTVQQEIPAAPSANSRYDVVWVRQRDAQTAIAPDGDNLPVFGVTSGAASATPSLATVLAAIPRGSLPLASLLVPSTATTTNGMTVAQIAPYTATAGSPFQVRTVADVNATLLSDVLVGQRVQTLDTGVLFEVRSTNSVKRWTRLGGGTFVGTRQQAIGNGAVSALGAFNRDAAFSDRDDFLTPGTNTIAEGDYVVSLTMGLNGVSGTGRNFVGIGGGGTAARNGFGAGEDTVTVATALHIPEGGITLTLQAFLTVASSPNSPNFRLQITKTG
jgi:hypothetical protein